MPEGQSLLVSATHCRAGVCGHRSLCHVDLKKDFVDVSVVFMKPVGQNAVEEITISFFLIVLALVIDKTAIGRREKRQIEFELSKEQLRAELASKLANEKAEGCPCHDAHRSRHRE